MPRAKKVIPEDKKKQVQAVAKPRASKKIQTTQKSSLTIDVMDLNGKIVDSLSLHKDVFGAKSNKVLITQAIRVYLANQRRGTVATKTRGEVRGSTRKIYRQKGTGRARHGGIRAPIFVGGGIVFGPKPRDYSLKLSQKMRQKALFAALSAKLQSNEMRVVAGLASIEPKTKAMATVLKHVGISGKKTLVVLSKNEESVTRSVRNIADVTYAYADQLNTYEVLNSGIILFMQEAVEALAQRATRKGAVHATA